LYQTFLLGNSEAILQTSNQSEIHQSSSRQVSAAIVSLARLPNSGICRNRAQPSAGRNLSPDAGFELQWKYSLYQTGFDKTVMESSLPASLVLRQVWKGLYPSRMTHLQRFDQQDS
jgi:hypothetical protein